MKSNRTLAASLPPRAGFTLIEILLAVALLAVATSVTYVCFATVASAWKRGQALSYDIHHADFVMEQLEMGLRSAYYQDRTCGFTLEDGGDGAGARDTISWVKLGGALVGVDCPFIGTPHRVKFFLEEGGDGMGLAAITAWRLRGQADDFDPDELPSIPVSKGIAGFNCRPRDPLATEVEWLDEWEETNRIPTAVELTLYMAPLDEGEDPVEIKRIVELPVAPLAWGSGAGTPGSVVVQPVQPGQGGALQLPPGSPVGTVPPGFRGGAVPPGRTSPGLPQPMHRSPGSTK